MESPGTSNQSSITPSQTTPGQSENVTHGAPNSSLVYRNPVPNSSQRGSDTVTITVDELNRLRSDIHSQTKHDLNKNLPTNPGSTRPSNCNQVSSRTDNPEVVMECEMENHSLSNEDHLGQTSGKSSSLNNTDQFDQDYFDR